MRKDIALCIARVSLGIVFLAFGIGKLRHDIWAQTIESMDIFQRMPWPAGLSVIGIGIIEICTGTGLIIGLWTRLVSLAAALQLLGILLLLNFQEIRDIGLFGLALYLFLNGETGFGIDRFSRQRKEKPENRL